MENRINAPLESTVDLAGTDRSVLSGELEQPKLANADHLKHNHKMNFGRFVSGCPRCEQIGPKEKKSKAKATVTDDTVTLTYAQLQQLMAAQAGSQTEALKVFAQELRKPDAEEQLKRDIEKARKEEARRLRLAEIAIKTEADLRRQQNCSHKKENGKSAINGQVHSDNLFHPICLRCQKEFDPEIPGRGMMTGAVA